MPQLLSATTSKFRQQIHGAGRAPEERHRIDRSMLLLLNLPLEPVVSFSVQTPGAGVGTGRRRVMQIRTHLLNLRPVMSVGQTCRDDRTKLAQVTCRNACTGKEEHEE